MKRSTQGFGLFCLHAPKLKSTAERIEDNICPQSCKHTLKSGKLPPMKSELKSDLDKLAKLAYHRFEWGGQVAREFHSLSKSARRHPDFAIVANVYQWLFVPITLWPIDLEGMLRA